MIVFHYGDLVRNVRSGEYGTYWNLTSRQSSLFEYSIKPVLVCYNYGGIYSLARVKVGDLELVACIHDDAKGIS